MKLMKKTIFAAIISASAVACTGSDETAKTASIALDSDVAYWVSDGFIKRGECTTPLTLTNCQNNVTSIPYFGFENALKNDVKILNILYDSDSKPLKLKQATLAESVAALRTLTSDLTLEIQSAQADLTRSNADLLSAKHAVHPCGRTSIITIIFLSSTLAAKTPLQRTKCVFGGGNYLRLNFPLVQN